MLAYPVAFVFTGFSLVQGAEPSRSISESFTTADRDRVLATEHFTLSRSVSKIPEAVSKSLAALLHSPSLTMAEPDQPFQATDVVGSKPLPWRRLVFSAQSDKLCALHYEKGGVGSHHLVLVFALEGGSARLIWGGTLFTELADVGALKESIRAGRIRPNWIEMNW